jgi:predicted HAD superfamily hydrolase
MQNYSTHTFDVFDTVITRKTATPAGIFALVEYELLKNPQYAGIPMRYRENFFLLRRNAEILANKVYKSTATFDNIYEMFCSNNDISENQLKQIQKLELETEYANSLPIAENIEKIHQLHSVGKKIIFISDMYLPSNFIQRLICKYAQDFEDIPIYVSCEHKCNKWNGELFAKVKECEKLYFEDWMHYGDSLQADFYGASKNGIAALKYNYPILHFFEKKLLEYYGYDASLQITIGTAKNIRIKKNIASEKFNNEFVYGCSYGAPMIYFYICWVLKQCAEKGIKRLYFMSRDGYIPKIVADYLIEKYKLGIQTKYIYSSRKAWAPVGFNENKKVPDSCFTLQSIVNYFDVPIEKIKTYIPDIDMKAFLTDEQREKINENIDLKKYLAKMQEDKSVITRQYLLQEIDFSDDYFAFVEVNGSGASFFAGIQLIEPFYQGNIRSFWNFCYNKVNSQNFKMHTYLYDEGHTYYIENLCRAPHGLVMGYEKNEDDEIVPIFGELDYGNFDFEAYIDGIKCFVEEYSDFYGVNENTRVFNKYFNFVLRLENQEIIDFHKIFSHNQIETDGIGNKLVDSLAILNAIVKIETKFQGLSIAIYGAGKYGKELKSKLGKKCMLWYDIAYENYISQGYNVQTPYKAGENNAFDIIIIAIENKDIAESARNFLMSINVPEEKIFWIKNI